MYNQIFTLLAFCLTFSFSIGQYKDYNCNSVIRDAQNKCVKNYDCYTADSLLLKADYYMENPPDERCLNHYGYFVILSGFYQSVLGSRNCSIEQVIYSLDKAIELILKAGELKPEWLKKNGEGAQILINLYSKKSQIYFDLLKDQQQYDIAIEQIKYWKQVYNGPVKQIDHTTPPNTTVYSKRDTLLDIPVVLRPREKKFASKHIVVLAQNKKQIIDRIIELKPLTDEHLSIHFDSDIQITPPDNPSRYKYKLLFEENVQHRVTVTYPGYEEQFFEFITTQAPQYDTLFVIMYPDETPLYYTKWQKRTFQPDSTSITIFPFMSKKEEFNLLIEELNLVNTPYSYTYKKKSGEPFDAKNDPILEKLRSYRIYQVPVGHNLDKNTLLTNQLRISWIKDTDEQTKEEKKEINYLLEKYQLKQLENDLYAAPLGIGFYLNTIVEELNQLQIVRSAYPETYQQITY